MKTQIQFIINQINSNQKQVEAESDNEEEDDDEVIKNNYYLFIF